ncbi:hypothetical protein [Candidatus Palauibacter sp.]|uniref:hypothetical protein n=1 Tax=Candidatus Palauibacter sp. TaxID=3101350 RepID=UPI003B02BF64
MALPQISKASRNEFREVLSGHFVLRDISDIFTGAGFSDDVTWEKWGNRRKLAEDYFATLNPARQRDIAMLLAAVNETAVRLTADGIPEGISDFIRLMREDGYSYEDGTFTAVQQEGAVTEELMMWSLSTYNFICYGSPDALVFRDHTGSSTFPRDRLFEYTSEVLKLRYETDVSSLAKLPALIVAEAMPDGKPETPAFLAQIGDVHIDGDDVRFRFRRIETEQFSSEEIFESRRFDTGRWEHSRTHWAVKEGDVLEGLFLFFADRASAQEALFPSIAKPRFVRLDDWPAPVLGHVAVMMPFDREYDVVYDRIRKACDIHKLDAVRVDDIYGPSSIIDDVFKLIVQSRFVISDLTNKNPNVLYETGIAHARNSEVIMIVQNDADIPFDLRHIRYIKYLPNDEGYSQLETDLVKAIAAIVE